jgi:hypothetical protein
MDSSPIYRLMKVLERTDLEANAALMQWTRDVLFRDERKLLLREIKHLQGDSDLLSRYRFPDTTGQ